jgi:hypothetical protein
MEGAMFEQSHNALGDARIRAGEREWLLDAEAREPVLLLWGPGGLGKTTLLQQYLKARDPALYGPVITARVANDATLATFLPALWQSLSSQAGPPLIDAEDTNTDPLSPNRAQQALNAFGPGRLLELVINAAERSRVRVQVDDLHKLGNKATLIVAALLSEARRSRWYLSSRHDIDALSRLGASTRLGPMTTEELRHLADLLLPDGRSPASRPTQVAINQAIAEAQGSPLKLERILLTSTTNAGQFFIDATPSHSSMLSTLLGAHAEHIANLTPMAALFSAQSLATVECLTELSPLQLQLMIRERLLIEHPADQQSAVYALHDIVSEAIRAESHHPDNLHVIAQLQKSTEPAAQLEAARWAIRAGQSDPLEELLQLDAITYQANAAAAILDSDLGNAASNSSIPEAIRLRLLGLRMRIGLVHPTWAFTRWRATLDVGALRGMMAASTDPEHFVAAFLRTGIDAPAASLTAAKELLALEELAPNHPNPNHPVELSLAWAQAQFFAGNTNSADALLRTLDALKADSPHLLWRNLLKIECALTLNSGTFTSGAGIESTTLMVEHLRTLIADNKYPPHHRRALAASIGTHGIGRTEVVSSN